jgi:acylphosphatase
MDICAKIVVDGVVQGVGFRYFVHHLANKLNLKGYTKNLYSGEVEVEVEGNEGIVKSFIEEVRIGPRSAHITRVDISINPCTYKYTNFEVKF